MDQSELSRRYKEVTEQIAALELRLKNLPEEMKDFLLVIERAQKLEKRIQLWILFGNKVIEIRSNFLKELVKLPSDVAERQEARRRLVESTHKDFGRALHWGKRIEIPPEQLIIGQETLERIVIQTPLSDLAEDFSQQNQAAEVSAKLGQDFLKQTQASIEESRSKFNAAKKKLKAAIFEARERRDFYHRKMMELRQIQHQAENKDVEITTFVRPPHSRKRKTTATVNLSPSQTLTPKPWKLFLVFRDWEDGKLMPSEQKEFTKALNFALKKTKLRVIKAKRLHSKIMYACDLDPAERIVQLERINGEGMCDGWYKLRLGSFRILLDINDEERKARFLPDNHDVYWKIFHS